jgi:hypothetical protein
MSAAARLANTDWRMRVPPHATAVGRRSRWWGSWYLAPFETSSRRHYGFLSPDRSWCCCSRQRGQYASGQPLSSSPLAGGENAGPCESLGQLPVAARPVRAYVRFAGCHNSPMVVRATIVRMDGCGRLYAVDVPMKDRCSGCSRPLRHIWGRWVCTNPLCADKR